MRVSGANKAVWRTGAARWRYCFKKYQKIGSPTEGAAGQSKERQGDRRSGAATEGAAGRPPKGFAAKEGG